MRKKIQIKARKQKQESWKRKEKRRVKEEKSPGTDTEEKSNLQAVVL